MKILIEAPKDHYQQYIAWIDQQPVGEPVIGTGVTLKSRWKI